MRFGEILFKTKNKEIFKYIMYREDLNVHILENLKMRELGYNLYIEENSDNLNSNYIIGLKKIIELIEKQKYNELNNIIISDKLYIKKEILQSQLDCMIKNNKPQNHIDSHKRAIKRQNKKILGYEERINNKNNK